MKDYSPSEIRNVSFIGHGSSGKTSLCEAILFETKAIERKGSVEEGNTHSDYTRDEIERGHSIAAGLLTSAGKETKLNLLDTPGFSDFIGEVKGALRVSDFAVVVVHGVSGIEVVTEQVWDFAVEGNVPRAFFINQLDKENADFEGILESLESTFTNTVVLQWAVNPGPGFNQIIDLPANKLLTYEKGKVSRSEIPGNLRGKVDELRETIVERAAEADDELLEKFFDKGELTEEEVLRGLRKGIREGVLYPVLCGSATEQTGIDTFVRFLDEYPPAVSDRPVEVAHHAKSGEEIELAPEPDDPVSLLVFKTTTEAHVGEMSYFRLFSGTLRTGMELVNTTSGGTEKINQISLAIGKQRDPVDHLGPGDMGVLVKLRDTATGDTLAASDRPVIINPPKFPEPSIHAAVVPKKSGEEDKIAEGLNILKKADPTFNVSFDPELKQTVISGQGDAQFMVILNRLRERFNVEAELVEPKIPYRETIKTRAEAEGKHKKQSGGRGQFGIAWIRVEPRERGEGYEFVDAIVGGVIPRQFIPAVDKGIQETMTRGVVAGFPLVDIRATVFDGKHHPVDSDEFSFKMAGSIGLREAVRKCKTVILEPVYEVEIKIPQENMGDVMGDISGRRGRVLNMDAEGKWQIIRVQIPLAELYKYANTLRSLTSGRGTHRRKFSHYEEVPGDIQQKLVEEYEARKAEASS